MTTNRTAGPAPIKWVCPDCHANTSRPIGSLALAKCDTHGWVLPTVLDVTAGR